MKTSSPSDDSVSAAPSLSRARKNLYKLLALCGIAFLALALRLVVWRWREFYELGGDEREYLAQALTLLQQRRYVELRLMRPPLYTLFLAGCIQLFDSLVQNLRLVQGCISAATVAPIWLLTGELRASYERGRRSTSTHLLPFGPSFVATLLVALSYTLAVNATELLSETLFLFGLTTSFWLLLRARNLAASGLVAWPWAAAAGLALGLLCLTRSVALPLLPLGGLWLAGQGGSGTKNREQQNGEQQNIGAKNKEQQNKGAREQGGIRFFWQFCSFVPQFLRSLFFSSGFFSSLTFVLCALLVILPWTARNYVAYRALIVIDTTGAENLWLDNNTHPQGRDGVKAELYALGEDRALRQRISTERGLATIGGDPAGFAAKAWGELLKFFALEYSDYMRSHPTIWVPGAEVWARLLLGDGLWLAALLGGVWGLCSSRHVSRSSLLAFSDPRWLFVPWALYTLLTAMLFHVELRYRLPLYPVFMPYAALALTGNRQQPAASRVSWLPFALCLVPLTLTLLHAPYPALAWQLGWKHYYLARAEGALAAGNGAAARPQALAALALDGESALARVALARVALLQSAPNEALAELDKAIASKPRHPHAHLLRGDLLRAQGDAVAASRELTKFERESLENLQRWSWDRFISPPPTLLDVGGGLDLGFVRGFDKSEGDGWRWSGAAASLLLRPPAPGGSLQLRMASGRPPGAPPISVAVLVAGQQIQILLVESDWRSYTLSLPNTSATRLEVELRADTFTPRDYDPASPDGRQLGVMVDWASTQ